MHATIIANAFVLRRGKWRNVSPKSLDALAKWRPRWYWPTNEYISPSSASTQTREDPASHGEVDVDNVTIYVPARPRPPESDDCCMSGCARCIYDVYADELEHYHEMIRNAIRKLKQRNIPERDWPASIHAQRPSPGDADAKVKDVADEEYQVDISDLDISMQEFLKLERRIKRKHKAE